MTLSVKYEIFRMAKQRVKERQDITGLNCIKGRQVGFAFDTEAARWQIWLEPAENRARDSKPGWETGDQDVIVYRIESSREVE